MLFINSSLLIDRALVFQRNILWVEQQLHKYPCVPWERLPTRCPYGTMLFINSSLPMDRALVFQRNTLWVEQQLDNPFAFHVPTLEACASPTAPATRGRRKRTERLVLVIDDYIHRSCL